MSATQKIIEVCKSDMDDEMLDLAHEAEREITAKDARVASLEAALTEAVELIKAWHNMDWHRMLTEEEYETMWQLYQQSPEMKRINAALKGTS